MPVLKEAMDENKNLAFCFMTKVGKDRVGSKCFRFFILCWWKKRRCARDWKVIFQGWLIGFSKPILMFVLLIVLEEITRSSVCFSLSGRYSVSVPLVVTVAVAGGGGSPSLSLFFSSLFFDCEIEEET